MCAVSMVIDHYRDEWGQRLPGTTVAPSLTPPYTNWYPMTLQQLTQAEIEEFRRLLDRAREDDKRNNEPDCEMDEKVHALKVIAKALGVELKL